MPCYVLNFWDKSSSVQEMLALALLATLAQNPSITISNAKAAAEYSRNNGGISFILMQNGKVIYEEYPKRRKRDQAHRTC